MYEGRSIKQIADFYNRYKITHYVMNFSYNLFETSSNPKHNRHHKPSVFCCANNHLYTIEKEEDKQTIFKIFASSIGGGVEKMNVIKEGEEEETDINTITTDRGINDEGIVTYENFLNNE